MKTYHFTRAKQTNIKNSSVSYVFKVTTAMQYDPGDALSVELLQEYIDHLKAKVKKTKARKNED